jgi:hypothetical protein
MEAEDYAQFILRRSHDEIASNNWWNGLLDAVLSLESFPARCPHIPEQSEFDEHLHQLLYESHRIIFQIHATEVEVVRIYHSSFRQLTPARLRRTPRLTNPH